MKICECTATTICDECAARIIEARNNELGQEAELPIDLTSQDITGMASLVDTWLDMLVPQERTRL